MLQIQGVKGEAVVIYREPLTTQEMRYPRLSRRVNNSAIFPLFVDAVIGEIRYRVHKLSKAKIFMAFQHTRTVVYATMGFNLLDERD